MLFSSSEVASYISATFEPAWESVRPAPTVTIDFGNGHRIKRTLQGNIATYICGPDGTVYDVLPGIYTPTSYCVQLDACKALANSLHAVRADSTARLSAQLRAYHAQRATTLVGAAQQPLMLAIGPQMRAIAQTGGGIKGGIGGSGGNSSGGGMLGGSGFGGGFRGIEGPTERVIMGLPSTPATAVVSQKSLADRPELDLDTQVNELIRRRQIHEHLARLGIVTPNEIKAWLFKEVLHADLDDPLLGLGKLLNENYPFVEEDQMIER